ncbi:MAG: Flp family type IVb pilin [Mesorhizobium sp.]|nr:Flp family type IVb pilin [Mesorhizobium sp.]MBL8578666.1 Flp family type IVb pilin [Mesorhizobium sp.]
MQLIRAFLGDKSGATGIEYGLIVGLITLAIVAGVGAVGNDVGDMFGNQDRELQKAFTR